MSYEFNKLSEVNSLAELNDNTNFIVEDSGDIKRINKKLVKTGGDAEKKVIFYFGYNNSSSSGGSDNIYEGSSGAINGLNSDVNTLTKKFFISKSLPIIESVEEIKEFLFGNGKLYDYLGNECQRLTSKEVCELVSNEGCYVVPADAYIITKQEMENYWETTYPNLEPITCAKIEFTRCKTVFYHLAIPTIMSSNCNKIRYVIAGTNWMNYSTGDNEVVPGLLVNYFEGETSEWS